MAETRMGVTPEDEDVTGQTVEPAQAEPAEQPKPEEKLLTQAEFDAALAKRLNEDRARVAAELDIARQQNAERDATIMRLAQELAQNRSSARPADPMAGLSDDEKLLARATTAAVAPVRKEMQDQLSRLERAMLPTLAKQALEDYWEALPGKIRSSPQSDWIKARAGQWLRREAQNGINEAGAVKLALAEYAERALAGEVEMPGAAPAAQPLQPAKPRPQPHTEIVQGRRTINPVGPADIKLPEGSPTGVARNFRALADAAEANGLTESPIEGAHLKPVLRGKRYVEEVAPWTSTAPPRG